MTQLVTIDIGGTHARFALADVAADGAITLGDPVTLHTEDHASFDSAWDNFRARHGGSLPHNVAIAIAGPVGGELIRFTNNPWTIRPAALPETLGVTRTTLVNDFAAVAHAVARAPHDQFEHFAGPDRPLPSSGTISVLGPGTGLGVAWLWRNGSGFAHVQATEGGHFEFAPLDEVEQAIKARLRKVHARVSVERVVSGPGIVDIYVALAELGGRAVAELDDVAIWTAALAGTDDLAVAAMERFCRSLGSVAGDVALVQGASGVVIAGGLGYRLRHLLPQSGFAERFCAKGRFAAMLAQLPVKLLTHPQPGLFGAAAAFAAEHG